MVTQYVETVVVSEFWVEVYKNGMPARVLKQDHKPNEYSLAACEWFKVIEYSAYQTLEAKVKELEEKLKITEYKLQNSTSARSITDNLKNRPKV